MNIFLENGFPNDQMQFFSNYPFKEVFSSLITENIILTWIKYLMKIKCRICGNNVNSVF